MRLCLLNVLTCSFCCFPFSVSGKVLHVPAEFESIQDAIDEADSGDTVLVAPGVYHEAIRIEDKSIKLTSHYSETNDKSLIRRTVLDGTLPDPDIEDDIEPMMDEVIYVAESAGPDTSIVGFTIRDGDDGIACYAKIDISHNRFINNVDGIDYEGGGGTCRFNEFVANDDDGVDLDESCEALVENNLIRDNDDDGIEIRLHEYRGETLKIVVRNNRITGNGEDGIQIIDYPARSDRHLRIEGNLIANNAMVGIGMMSDGNTRENFEAASIPERIEIINNTIAENQYGITGGDKVIALNNIFMLNSKIGAKQVDGSSQFSHNLFWQNGNDEKGCNQSAQSLMADPQLDANYRPGPESPCVDGGIATFKDSEGNSIVVANGKDRKASIGAFGPEHKVKQAK